MKVSFEWDIASSPTRIISRPPKKDRPGLGLRFAFVWFSQMPSSSICIYDDENMLMKNMRMQIWWWKIWEWINDDKRYKDEYILLLTVVADITMVILNISLAPSQKMLRFHPRRSPFYDVVPVTFTSPRPSGHAQTPAQGVFKSLFCKTGLLASSDLSRRCAV